MARQVQGANLLFKAVEVLDAVAEAQAPPRLAELARSTGLPLGTLHRITDALAASGLLRRDAETRAFRLGSHLLQLARRSWEDFDLRGAAEPEMRQLHETFSETVSLAVLLDGGVVLIDKIEGTNALRTAPPLGQRLPLHASAIGKTVLAALEPAEKVKALAALDLVPLTPTTIADRATLAAHLAMMEARRYAVEDEEQVVGVRAVAAAILNQRGAPIGAIGLSGSAKGLSLDRLFDIGSEIAEAALRISWNLGFAPPEPWPGFSIAARSGDPVENAVPAAAFVGTSPVWDEATARLFWVDRMRPGVHVSDPATGADTTLPLPGPAGSVVRTPDGLLATLRPDVLALDQKTGATRPLFSLMTPDSHQRYNTARCDRQGRLWITTMDLTISRASGSLVRVDPDLRATEMATGFLVPIGLTWSPCGRYLYICDAPRREIYRYAFDEAAGTIADRRVFARLPEQSGRPTGLAVDRSGFVWSLQTDGWCVTRYDPDGQIERVVALPVPKPIDCCFGGPDMRTLFITTSRLGLAERRLAQVPWSGSVLAYECPEPGLPAGVFGEATPACAA